MKLTEIMDNLIKDLDDHVNCNDFTFYLYHYGKLIFTEKANKRNINKKLMGLMEYLDALVMSRAYRCLKDDSVADGYGYRIEGTITTITYEIRHDYIPAKDGDDA